MNFGKKNQRETIPEGATRQGGAPQGVRRALDPIGVQNSAQSELRISGYKRNGERPDLRAQKQRETERQIQSRRGSHPSAAMEAMDQG